MIAYVEWCLQLLANKIWMEQHIKRYRLRGHNSEGRLSGSGASVSGVEGQRSSERRCRHPVIPPSLDPNTRHGSAFAQNPQVVVPSQLKMKKSVSAAVFARECRRFFDFSQKIMPKTMIVGKDVGLGLERGRCAVRVSENGTGMPAKASVKPLNSTTAQTSLAQGVRRRGYFRR